MNESRSVVARNVVAASQPLAAQAGVRMMQQGGNAVDAVIAAAAALMVVEPVSSGLGSDAFAMVYQPSGLHALNASGRSPRSGLPSNVGQTPLDYGWPSVTVPGAVAGWVALSEKFGKLPFVDLMQPAIEYASEGYAVTPVVARVWRGLMGMYMKFPEVLQQFFPGGRVPEAGATVTLPHMANSLTQIGHTKGAALYSGELAQRIADHARATQGSLSMGDLQGHSTDWVQSPGVSYHGAHLHEMPPNSQGIASLIALGILSYFDLARCAADATESVHLQIEAMKLGLADAYAHVGDLDTMQTGVAELLSQHRLKELAAKISLNEARYPGQLPTPAGSGTSYLCAADCQGMVVSYIQSSGPGFGSGIVVPGTGIALQSRASGFNFNPGHPNCYAPNKRPFHTNCPAILTNGDDAVTAFGLMGWSMQPQAHVQFAVRAVDHSQSPTSILAAPRWRIAVDEPAILLEPGFPEKTQSGLAALGHKIIKTEKFFSASTPFGSHLMFGGANMLCKAPTGWNAACDPRRDGLPAGC